MIHLIIIQNFRDAKKLSMPRNTTQLKLSQHIFGLAECVQLCPVLQLLILNICVATVITKYLFAMLLFNQQCGDPKSGKVLCHSRKSLNILYLRSEHLFLIGAEQNP